MPCKQEASRVLDTPRFQGLLFLLPPLHHFRAHLEQAHLCTALWEARYRSGGFVDVILSQRSRLFDTIALNDKGSCLAAEEVS